MARKRARKTVVFENRWDAARDKLKDTKREGAPKLDIDRIIAAAGEMTIAYELDDDAAFARALDRIVCYAFDAGRGN